MLGRDTLGRDSYLVPTSSRIPILRSIDSSGPWEGIPANQGARRDSRTSHLLNRAPDPTPQAGAALVFWLLVTMGVGTLAPCVILPEWRGYQALNLQEQAQRHRVESLQAELDRQHRLLEAMRSDPGAIARLAQRDLRYYRPDERIVSVSVLERTGQAMIRPMLFGPKATRPFVPNPAEPPLAFARVLALLPRYDYDAIFCDEQTRRITFVMSVALIGMALGLFGPSRRL